ncbi:Uncharacterized protein APZ42_010349 [Daphnia magna]|uniref:Uncharacterized protein n=1 Tax=Daphnia magna TaxID=35525 RepID=A0A164DFI7_9CRUS|nr:Uncharacterized protein APZ42_010349 [Daphnia magna]
MLQTKVEEPLAIWSTVLWKNFFPIKFALHTPGRGKQKKGKGKNCFSALRRINAAIFSVVRANSRLQVEEKEDDDVELYIREWLRHSQEKCDRKGISSATYEDPMNQ